MLKIILFGGLPFLLGCNSVPERPTGPLNVSTFDTIVRFQRFIVPFDTLVINSGFASQTEVNTIHVKNFRSPISDQFEYSGPDSDWHFTQSFVVLNKLDGKNHLKIPVPGFLRPGQYSWKVWMEDAQKKHSDTSRFSFPINSVDYPFMTINIPANPGVKTKLINKDTIYPDSARIKLLAYTNIPDYFSIQWWDSIRKDSLDKRSYLNLKGTVSPFLVDTLWKAPDLPKKNFQLKLTLNSTENRKMVYWIPFYRK